MVGQECCKNEEKVTVIDFLKSYAVTSQALVDALRENRYQICFEKLGKLEQLSVMLGRSDFRFVFSQKFADIEAWLMKIQELQLQIYESSLLKKDDLLKKYPKDKRLSFLEKFS